MKQHASCFQAARVQMRPSRCNLSDLGDRCPCLGRIGKIEGAARRLIQQGGVRIESERVTDIETFIETDCTLWAGKKRAVQIKGRTNRLGAAHKLGVLMKTSQRSVLILGLLMSTSITLAETSDAAPLCNRIQPAKRKQSAQAPTCRRLTRTTKH